jgi:Na+-driven multidrug efflux pump
MWGVRMSVSALVAPVWGLVGVWCAMAGELCLRGILFAWRLLRGRWLDRAMIV